ncbi:MAG: hypothetical protein IPL65_10795 [Lewinellaceae bacterium]|nr:hypothetical protein [Lewinellaceae bacterium]
MLYGALLGTTASHFQQLNALNETAVCTCNLDLDEESDEPTPKKDCPKEDKNAAQDSFTPLYNRMALAENLRVPHPEPTPHFQSDNHPAVATPPPKFV